MPIFDVVFSLILITFHKKLARIATIFQEKTLKGLGINTDINWKTIEYTELAFLFMGILFLLTSLLTSLPKLFH